LNLADQIVNQTATAAARTFFCSKLSIEAPCRGCD